MRHLNIAFYSDTYRPAFDGAVNSMLDFKRELEKRGHKVYIIASATRQDKKKYSAPDVFLHTGLKFRPYPQYSVALFPYYSTLKLRKLDIDLIHAQTPFVMGFNGLLAAKFGRYPLVGTFHTLINSKSLDHYYPKNRVLKRFFAKSVWKYTKFFYRSCDVTIAPSDAIAYMLRKHKISNVQVVPSGVNIRRFNGRVSGEKFRREFNVKGKEKIVLYLGRISKEKKLEVFLRAAKQLIKKRNDLKFVVAGSGPALSEYMRFSKKLGLSGGVSFPGFIKNEDLPSLYAASDVFCFPSTFETQGMVALEAMACGKPVVGANSLGLSDLLDGKNGEKFRAGDHLGCAQKIEKVLNSYDSYKKNAIKTARDYSTEKATDRLLNIYEFLVSKQAVY